MTTTYNVHEAKTHLSKLLERGEEIVIARAGKPVARLVPERTRPRRRPEPGSAKGEFVIHESFYDDLPEWLLDLFEGKNPGDPLNDNGES